MVISSNLPPFTKEADGKHFIYLASVLGGENESNAVFIGSLDGGAPREVGRANSNFMYAAGNVLFVRNRTLFAQPFNTRTMQLDGDPKPLASDVQSDRIFSRASFSASQNGLLSYVGGGDNNDVTMRWVTRSTTSGSAESGQRRLEAAPTARRPSAPPGWYGGRYRLIDHTPAPGRFNPA